MEVYSALLGERLTVLEADEFEGKTVKSVKQSFAAQFPGFAEDSFLTFPGVNYGFLVPLEKCAQDDLWLIFQWV